MSGTRVNRSVCWLLTAICFTAGAAGQSTDTPLDGIRERLQRLQDGVRPEPIDDTVEPVFLTTEWRFEDPQWSFGVSTFPRSVEVDIEGSVVFSGIEFPSPGGDSYARIFRVSPCDTGSGCQSGTRLDWNLVVPDLDSITVLRSDSDANIFAGGRGQDGTDAIITKFTRDGFRQWSRVLFEGINAFDIGIDLNDEGVPFAVAGSAGVSRIDPFLGVAVWTSTAAPSGATNVTFGNSILVDSTDDSVLAFASYFLNDGTFTEYLDLVKFSGESGELLWRTNLATSTRSRGMDVGGFALADDGTVYCAIGSVPAGTDGYDSAMTAVRPDGTIRWSQIWSEDPRDNQEEGFRNPTIDAFGNVYALVSRDEGAPNPGLPILSWTSDGTFRGDARITGPRFLKDLRADNFGNVYVATTTNTTPSGSPLPESVYKMEGLSWVFNSTPPALQTFVFNAGSPFSRISSRAIFLDRAANLYVAAQETDNPYMSERGSRLTVTKSRQTFIASPISSKSNPAPSFEDQSIWAPGVGLIEENIRLFDVPLGLNVGFDESFTIPFLGSFGGAFNLTTTGMATIGARAEVVGGTVDLHFPMNIEFLYPSARDAVAGQMITIQPSWDSDAAARMTTCFSPSINAGITGGIDVSAFSFLSGEAFSQTVFNETLFDASAFLEEDYIPVLNLQSIASLLGIPLDGEWYTTSDPRNVFEVSARLPRMVAQGRFNENSSTFNTFEEQDFLSLQANVTQLISTLTNIPLEDSRSGSARGVTYSYFIGFARALITSRLSAEQALEVQVTPKVLYEFSDGLPPITLDLDEQLQFPLPADGTVEILPTVFLDTSFSNMTDLGVTFNLGFETIRAEASLSFAGFPLIDESECLACIDEDVGSVDIPIFDNAWPIQSNGVTLPTLRIQGTTDTQPTIYAASRDCLPMIIYDQTSPNQAFFNLAANGITRMLLYGERFFDSPGLDPWVSISHHGRSEIVPSQRLNDFTIFVEIPNRFRLLPGVARIRVERFDGTGQFALSNSIDLPIVYPSPKLDAVNPNLWAADPDMNTIPVQVIDKESLLGNDTFIARRDYYIKLRDELWNASTTPFGTSAELYFPAFDFDGMPEFPAVLFNGVPLPRFVQPVDSGIHNVRLSQRNYDRPGLIDVQICNPGPGGGVSRTLTLNIAAPIPVMDFVEPGRITPGSSNNPGEGYTITVGGPKHVPFVNNLEEPKYGNFNAGSIVLVNGNPVPTTYVSTSRLEAFLHPGLVQHPGQLLIEVETPSNGTVYFEQRFNPDGSPDPFIDVDGNLVNAGFLPSGGVSGAVLIDVAFANPVVTAFNPPFAPAKSAAFNGTPEFNLGILGSDFRPGTSVLVDGEPRLSEVVSSGHLRVALLPGDVDRVRTLMISIMTPGAPDIVDVLYEVTLPTRRYLSNKD